MSKCYIVTFEIPSEITKQQFIEKLKKSVAYCPINETCWAIITEQAAIQIRDSLTQNLSSQDRIFIIRSGTEAAWLNTYGEKYTDWLKKNL